jgi:DNA sulfur modification protein DndB
MEEINGLVKLQDISDSLIRTRKAPYIYVREKPSKKEFLEKEGWEIVPSKNKKSIKMRKLKTHFDAFEDRIWALFAKMGFSFLNENNKFSLQYAPDLSKKIDIFAADEEAILIVECKSSSIRKSVNYQKDINELIGIKDGMRQAAQKLFPGKPKVAFIFATNNSILGDTDETRLTEGAIFHFSDADIEYWQQLVDHLGPAAKYQLFGKLFAGQEIPNLPNRVPAIRGKMHSGNIFYSFSIDPNFLLKMGFILHRRETDSESSDAYQRLVNKKRLQDIGKFIDEGGYFPNSIIVNIVSKKKELKFEPASNIEHDSDTSFGVLHLPKLYRSLFIIDGQHRLYGYSKTNLNAHHTIPVVAFLNLPQDEQAKIFVDINHTQKSVPKSLLKSIMADFDWNSDDASRAVSALKTRLLSRLNFDENSPLYNRIVLTEEENNPERCLTLETILKWGFSSNMGFFGKIKGKRLIKTGYLTDVSYDETLIKSLSFFKRCFEYVKDELPDQWNAGTNEGGFICMNIGIAATVRTIDQIFDYLTKQKNVKTEDQSGTVLADQVIEYLIPVTDFLKRIDSEGLKKLRGYFGSGAPEKVTMEFLNAIHTEFDDFNPEGLSQWIIDHTGAFNMPSYELGYKNIEPLMHEFIIRMLKKELGEKAWWKDGIPTTIQKSCADARIDAHSSEPDWNFLTTIHYRDIIDKNWALLGNYFTPPSMENEKKDKRLSWLVKFNSIRQRYSHPQRDIIKEEEFNFLKETHEWLKAKLNV